MKYKKYLIFFLIILIPNILRQLIYYVTYLKTNSTDFIVSFETVAIYNKFPFVGIIEEITLGIVFVLIWFRFSKIKFLAYGWITDALFDFISVLVWFFVGLTPLQLLGLNTITRFILREIVLFYFVAAPILYYKLKTDIKKLSFIYSLIGLIILVLILVL